MTIRLRLTKALPGAMAGLLVLFGLYLISLYSYLLFHTLVELFSIIVAGAIFLVAWNARHLLDNDYPLFLGISFLFVAVLDSLHTLAYQGMGVFPDFGTNVPTQLWLASRYLQASSFLVAPLFLRRRISARWTVAAGVLLVALILVSIFVWPVFPDAYVEGQGLTPFKVASEYVISGMLLLAGFLIWQRRQVFDPAVWRLLVAAILFNVGAELSFTFYIGVYDLSNLVGHFFKVLSFYFIYKAVVETGLVKPYSLLFRELKRSESGLREERDLISAILEVAGALIVVLDPQGRIVRFNRACELVTGYTAEAVRGLPLWDLFLLPEEIESVKAVFANLMSGQFPISYENYWLGKDGERRLITWSNTVILDEAGAVEYVVATGLDITEQRRAEVENLSLAQFPLQNPNPVLRVSAEGRILYGNEGSAPLLRCWNVEVGDSQPPEWCRFTEDVYRSGSRQESDVECDGRIYSLVYAPVLAGGYVNIYGMDVTNRRQIEVQLRKLSRAVEQSPSTVVITDTEGNIEYANPKFSELTGYSLDEVVGQSPRILRSEEHDEAFYRELWDTISAGDEWRGEFRNRKKNGEFYWEIASISPVRNGEGRIIHFVKVGEDISERKRREKRLHWQLEVNAALSHLSRALLSQISLDGVSSLVLEHAKRLTDSKFGYVGYIDPETGHLVCPTMTHDIWEVCKVKDKTPVFETFGGLWGWVLEQGRSLLTNAPAADPRSKGTPEGHLAIHTFVSAPALSGGKVVGQIALANASHDYTQQDLALVERLADLYAIALERHWAEAALVQRTEELQRRNEELDAFAHTVAHDLKNPLSLVIGYSEALAEDEESLADKEREHYLDTIIRSGHKVNEIIDELLLLAEVRKRDVKATSLDMCGIVEDAWLRLIAAVDESQAEIVLPDTWPPALGHGPWVEEVWANYLSNAIKYGGRPPRVKVGAVEQDDGMVRFWVRDNGPGLTAEDQAQLFTAFTQLARPSGDGHGLGLSIVRRIVEKLGGQVAVESEGVPGRGCVFSFTLPAAKANPPEVE